MKKILSVLLVAVLLVSSLGLVSVVAEDSTPVLSYTVTGTYALGVTTKVTKELFGFDVTVDSTKIAALDGESKAYTYDVVSIVANGIDYFVDEEAFFARYEACTEAVINIPFCQGYCYTQLTDVMQEINGLLTPDRKPKMDVERLRKMTHNPV